MFKARFRATTEDFAENAKQRKNLRTIPGSFFLMQFRKNPIFKIAVVVSKKVHKNSVNRHYLKRQALHALKEILLEKNKNVENLPKYLIMFLAKVELGCASYADIKKDLYNLVSKIPTDILP